FISFEDKLMRLFGSDRMARILSTMGLKDDDMLESKQLSKQVENAQKKVEENNYGVRKHLLDYDDVKNAQRKVIYTRRNHALMGERIGLDVLNTLTQTAESLTDGAPDIPFEEFKQSVFKAFSTELPITEEQYRRSNPDQLVDAIMEEVIANLKRRSERMAEVTYPVLKAFYDQHGDNVERIAIPVTDGRLGYNVVTNLKEAVETEGKSVAKAFQKTILLYTIDEAWERHLLAMDELQNAVRNVSYENKDPLVIFKVEAYELFRSMVIEMNQKASEIIMRGHVNIAPQQEDEQRRVEVREQREDPLANRRRRYQEQKDDYEAAQQARYEAGQAASQQPQKQQPYIAEQKIGRNDPCPCGSGKKFKNCHGRNL
ncbi:SEC-C metal-binding domain-containing protein, partial [Porphyromonas sp. CAG:1061]